MLLKQNAPGQALHRTATNHMVEGDFTTVKNRTIKTDITRNMVENKTTNWSSNVSGKQSSRSKTGSLVKEISKIDSERVSNKYSPFSKRKIPGKIPNLKMAGRLAHFSKSWEKLTQDQEILSVVKVYVIPFLNVPVQRNIPKQMATSKTQELLINQETTEMLDKGAIKKVEHQFPD